GAAGISDLHRQPDGIWQTARSGAFPPPGLSRPELYQPVAAGDRHRAGGMAYGRADTADPVSLYHLALAAVLCPADHPYRWRGHADRGLAIELLCGPVRLGHGLCAGQ